MAPPANRRTFLSDLSATITDERSLQGLTIGFGTLDGHDDVDGKPIPVIAGPDKDAAGVYVVHRLDAKTGRYRDDVLMLGFSGPPLARAIFFAQATSHKEYRQLDTWKADAFAAWLAGEDDEDDSEDAEESATA